MNKILVLFTSSFPYKGGEQFLETEINYLAEKFEKIIIVPAKKNEYIRNIPNNVIIDNFIADANKSVSNRILSLFNISFFKSLKPNINYIEFLAIQMLYIKLYKKLIESYVYNYDLKQTLFYTYWFSAGTTSLYFIKKKHNALKYITRVHRGDLYENIHSFEEFPYRKEVMKNINMVYSISENGKEHLIKKYPRISKKIIVARLGVKKQDVISKYSDDGVFRILSCSWITEVKRVHLIVDALSHLKGKDVSIVWTHIGDGPLMEEIKDKAKRVLGDNIQYNFKGFMDNIKVIDFYKENPIDCFLNVSSSEGVPVSIMEAQSFGVPVIATDVGGTSEIVNDNNGILVNKNVSAEELANTLLTNCIFNINQWNKKRKLSYDNWEKYYDASRNYKDFTKGLIEI